MASARESINSEKIAAISELKTQAAAFSIEIAEKLVALLWLENTALVNVIFLEKTSPNCFRSLLIKSYRHF